MSAYVQKNNDFAFEDDFKYSNLISGVIAVHVINVNKVLIFK